MTTFETLGLAKPILNALDREGYNNPTPIQAQAIPHMLEGRDMIGIAQTGTGKTAAFVLPQLHKLAVNELAVGQRVNAKTALIARSAPVLVLTPTRELASQIATAIKAYGQIVKPAVVTVIGGARPGPQVRAMAKGAHFIVATPGRLLDHMQTGAIHLDAVQIIILDEADHMLDLGFLPGIRKIMKAVPKNRQTLLFSATMPKQIRQLADDFLRDPVEVSVAPASKPIDRIDQLVAHVQKRDKPKLLARLIKEDSVERGVVFTRTKHGANRLCRVLGEKGINAEPIHGNKSQSQREKTLKAFRSGRLPILVATDIAARGIDIDGVSHVYNYDLPEVAEVYVHRIGRTARAGRTGKAIAFCDAAERPLLKAIEKLTGASIPVMATDGEWVVDAPVQEPSIRNADDVQRKPRKRRNRPGSRSRKRDAVQNLDAPNQSAAKTASAEGDAKPAKRRFTKSRKHIVASKGEAPDGQPRLNGKRRNRKGRNAKPNGSGPGRFKPANSGPVSFGAAV